MKNKPSFDSSNLVVLSIGAHPDDSEFRSVGTALKLHRMGAMVYLLSVSDGSAGHFSMGRKELAERRGREAGSAAELIGGKSLSLGIPDGEVMPSIANREKLIRVIRQLQPDLILINRLNDYHPDHRYTSQLVQDASYMLMVPNVCPDTPALHYVPLILEWGDQFMKPRPFSPDIVIGIDDVLDDKLKMLSKHESQLFEWLPWVDGNLDIVPPASDENGRAEFVRFMYSRRPNHFFSERFRDKLIERYGEAEGRSVEEAEAFEISEYGYKPTEEELDMLFGRL